MLMISLYSLKECSQEENLMTSKCLKNKILSVALCFLLGGALNELNARVNTGGIAAPRASSNNQMLSNVRNTKAPVTRSQAIRRNRVNEGNQVVARRRPNRDTQFAIAQPLIAPTGSSTVQNGKKMRRQSAVDMGVAQSNADAAQFDARLAFNRSSERDGAADENIDAQKLAKYAREKADATKKLDTLKNQTSVSSKYPGGSNLSIYQNARDNMKTAHSDFLTSINGTDARVMNVLMDSDALSKVTNGKVISYFGKENEADQKQLAKDASAVTAKLFEHIADTKNMEMFNAALNSLAGNEDAVKKIKDTKVSSSLPGFDKVKYLFEQNGTLNSNDSTIRVGELLDLHKELLKQMASVSADSYKGKLLKEQLDIITSLCTSTGAEVVRNLNDYDKKTGKAELDIMSHDNVIIDLSALAKNIKAEEEHYNTIISNESVHSVKGSDTLFEYICKNVASEMEVLTNKESTTRSKNEASVHILNVLAEHGSFEEFHSFITAYTDVDKAEHLDKMHKQTVYSYVDENKKTQVVTAEDLARFLKGGEDAKLLSNGTKAFLSGMKKEVLTDAYVKNATTYLNNDKWHLTIPIEDYNSMVNSHELAMHELANKKVANQNNKNTATEEK